MQFTQIASEIPAFFERYYFKKKKKNKKNYVFNEAASKDYVCINQGTKPGLFLIISDHSQPPHVTIFNHF